MYFCIESGIIIKELLDFELEAGHYVCNRTAWSNTLTSYTGKHLIDAYSIDSEGVKETIISDYEHGDVLDINWNGWYLRIPEDEFDSTLNYYADYKILHFNYDNQQVEATIKYTETCIQQ